MASGSPYVPALGGAYKANRLLAEGLVARGHEVTVLALGRTAIGPAATREEFRAALAARGIDAEHGADESRFVVDGVRVHAVGAGVLERKKRLAQLLAAEEPDAVLVSSEDWRQLLLGVALAHDPRRTVYLAHTGTSLPMGPTSAEPNPRGAALLARAAAVVTPSRWLADYVAAHAPGARVEVVHAPAFGPGPFPRYHNAEAPFVTLVNPSPLKGLSIFLGLAAARPSLAFAAVPSWGTGEAERAALAERPNVTLLPPSERIDDFLARTRVLLVPSLWQEVFGLVVVEAMVRGIPVVTSDQGGLVEAGLGAAAVVPVTPISAYRIVDGMPVAAAVPPQELGPWLAALDALGDRARYEEASRRCHAAARAFVDGIGVERYEALLASLERAA